METSQSQPPCSSTTKKKKPKQPSSPIIPWTHDETTHLIGAYQDKWYSLRRGQLKLAHWEEVSVTVAARSGHDDPSASKSALQCRHKMEKLRQRFRSESNRFGPSGSAWAFFGPMDRLLRGPFPISALPMVVGDARRKNKRRSRSINRILRGEDDNSSEKSGCDDGIDGGLVVKVASEVRVFAERLVAMERVRMEVARETEKARMEMERKRIDMIVRSQTKIADAIAKAFA